MRLPESHFPVLDCSPDIRQPATQDGHVNSHAAHTASCEKDSFDCASVFPKQSKWRNNSYGYLVAAEALHFGSGSLVTASSYEPGRILRWHTRSTVLFSARPTIADEHHRKVCASAAGMGGGTLWTIQQNTRARLSHPRMLHSINPVDRGQ